MNCNYEVQNCTTNRSPWQSVCWKYLDSWKIKYLWNTKLCKCILFLKTYIEVGLSIPEKLQINHVSKGVSWIPNFLSEGPKSFQGNWSVSFTWSECFFSWKEFFAELWHKLRYSVQKRKQQLLPLPWILRQSLNYSKIFSWIHTNIP